MRDRDEIGLSHSRSKGIVRSPLRMNDAMVGAHAYPQSADLAIRSERGEKKCKMGKP
jgi:hypothetical protein